MVSLFVLSLHPTVHSFVLAGLGRFEARRVLGLAHRLYEAYSPLLPRQGALARNVLLTLIEHALQMVVFLLVTRSLGSTLTPCCCSP